MNKKDITVIVHRIIYENNGKTEYLDIHDCPYVYHFEVAKDEKIIDLLKKDTGLNVVGYDAWAG